MTKDAVYEEENLFLNHVLTNIDYKIDKMKKQREFSKQEAEDIGIPDLEDKGTKAKFIREYFEFGPKIEALKNLKKVPHFGRMDLKITEDNNAESLIMYIGEKSITDKDLKTLVYDWRSPVANLYYMANQTTFTYNDTNYDLKLKRQIDIENAKLISYATTYEDGKTINVTDSFLLKVLEQKKNRNEFADIIRTIQSNQNNIIRESISNNTVVQGVAGSGKTVVLLHRISYLTYNHREIDPNHIIFITPSKIFKSKLEKINRSLALTDILMITIKEYYLSKIKKYIPSLKIKDVIDDDNNPNPLKELYSDEFIITIDNIIHKELKDIDNKLQIINQNIDYTNIHKSLTLINEKIKTSLKNETWNTFEERDTLNNLKSEITIYLKKDIIKKLIDSIYKYLKEKYNLRKNSWINNKVITKAYAYLVIYVYQKYGFYLDNEYKYIFIDEMQDYANNEIRNIISIEKNPNINFYGDINQNIIPYIPKKTIDELKNLININHKNNVIYYELLQNYRNTKQITNYCNSFIETKMEPMGIISDEVLEKSVKDIVFDIKENYSNEYTILTNDINIKNSLPDYETFSIRDAKGLEFSKVIVVDINLTPIERYVAFTRTLDKLIVYK